MSLLQRPRGRVLVWLIAVLALALVALTERTDLAEAEDITASDVCWLNPAPGVDACPRAYAPPGLLSRDAYAAMTPEESAALHRLEAQALDTVLGVHGLPESDRNAVATWARSDAQAALLALVMEAIDTDAAQRTPDQQQAVDWMGDLVRAVVERSASRSGAEYAKWAGLDVRRYWQLVDADASEEDLKTFLSQRPQPYDVTDMSKATGGWCKYTPPAGSIDSDYSARDAQSCFTPCTGQYLCEPEPPERSRLPGLGQGRGGRRGARQHRLKHRVQDRARPFQRRRACGWLALAGGSLQPPPPTFNAYDAHVEAAAKAARGQGKAAASSRRRRRGRRSIAADADAKAAAQAAADAGGPRQNKH